jgi:hypothetical protein
MKQFGADLGIRQPVAGQSGILGLLCREDLTHPGCASAYRLARGHELTTGALGERLGAETVKHLVRGPQLLARVEAPVLATQPFAVHQVGTSEVNGDPAASEAIDGFDDRANRRLDRR